MRPIFTVMSDTRPTLVLAGAAGFIGQALATALHARFRVVGLSRSARRADAHVDEYRRCDLFNLREADAGLAGADYAVYLVHSMMPSARLTQGSFADMDLICADNFARAAKRAGVRQIVYLGGLIPAAQTQRGPLSAHLRSRLEVERTLGRYGTPVTALRAGIILGAHGSSFQILLRLVRRLPLMVLPAWTQTRTQPVALADVVALLSFVVGQRACFGRSFDVGTPETVSYAELMTRLAAQLGRPLKALPVPLISPKLSRLWISLVTGAPRALVEPLIESLRHEMVARDHALATLAGRAPTPLDAALGQALADAGRDQPRAFARAPLVDAPLVRSVQRMRLPAGRDAAWAAGEYARWLPRGLRGLIRVDVDNGGTCRFFLAGVGLELLVLRPAPERSSPDRQLYFIDGGRLAHLPQRGRFELRQLFDGRTLMTAIHDYQPRLPWALYVGSQALVHRWVMWAFARHLRGQHSVADPVLRHVLAGPTDHAGQARAESAPPALS